MFFLQIIDFFYQAIYLKFPTNSEIKNLYIQQKWLKFTENQLKKVKCGTFCCCYCHYCSCVFSFFLQSLLLSKNDILFKQNLSERLK